MANDLVVAVGANVQQLERQMKAAARASEKAASDIENRFRKVNPTISTSALTGALKGFAAAFTVDRIIRGLADANAELVRVGETAKRVGLDLQRFQELQFAGRQNGLSGKDFGTGLEGLAEKLNESRQKENELTQLFADNNIKLKDRKGEVIGVNEALGKAAELVRNAATEFDKIKIAEALGLTKEWIPLLEQGAEALNRQASAARDAGAVIDSDIIQRAKAFERDWAAAIDRWATLFRANAGSIIEIIDTIIGKAGQLFSGLDRYSKGLQAKADLEKNGAAGASRATIDYARSEFAKTGEVFPKELQQRLEQLNEVEREAARARAREGGAPPLEVTVRRGRPTDTSSLFGGKGGGGGGGGGASEAEQAQQRLDRYIETLMRQNSVLDAEIATFGRSNAEKRAAVELAKAQVDLAKLDESERQKIIASLTREIELSEQKRTQLESLKSAQKGLADAQKFFGDAAVDALEDLIFNGAKAEDVVKNLAKSLAKAAIQAALLGTGPFAGIFGTTGTNGGTGGIFGLLPSLFGRATGGPVNAMQPYRVGERGPETFVPTVPGKIVPSGRGEGLRVVINNSAAGQVQASAQRQPNGDLSVAITAMEGAMAERVVRRQGPMAAAMGAVRDSRQLRG
ncbi:MAG TPA: hypothetical protein VGV17_02990 [Bosea sp. (in: a-proteobacteria)]|jgi:hypothetical protein|uniref:hypothetical protein n=1 Tax=Bosea sp. (in: a-proteobacteria) TaxID=1871050 RepID=UPI002DDD2BCB|nr:hypothetical protein [Bosea sp. (in: a-proteobacteria)]HEV2552711.1 hypothetical protein [Bosea sp. (in: a-proteobacteria)]